MATRNRRPLGRQEEGAALVESAIVLSLVFLLTFAILDGALFMKDYLSAGYATRAAARAESGAGNNALADYFALQEIKQQSKGLSAVSIKRIVVFKATSLEDEPHADCIAGIPRSITTFPDSACNVYEPGDMDRDSTDFTSTWSGPLAYPATGRNAKRSTTPDLVGVYLQVETSTPAGALGKRTWVVERTSVMQLEAKRR